MRPSLTGTWEEILACFAVTFDRFGFKSALANIVNGCFYLLLSPLDQIFLGNEILDFHGRQKEK